MENKRINRQHGIWATVVMALALHLAAAPLMGQATLVDDTIALGDQTTLSVPLAGDTLPVMDLDGSTVLVLGQRVDTATRTLQALITSFEPGEHWLHTGDGDSLLLVVTDVEVDTASTEIRDIAPIQRVPYTFWEVFRWVLLVLVVAAAGFAAWWTVRNRKKVQQVLGLTAPVDTRTPEERALEALEELRRQNLWQSGQVKEYHTLLTDAVRRFIEEATGIRATDMTSDECLNALMHDFPNANAMDTQAIKQSSIQALKDIFSTADLVKFAKSEPLPHEHEASMGKAVEFVKTLWQQVKPQEAGEGRGDE